MKADTRFYYENAVRRALSRIASGLDEALDLSALARSAALSPLHFHRIFKGMIGETPLELHRRLRMERAASRLLLSEASVTEIAFDAGYETHEAFTRAFRLAFGMSPSGFRESTMPPARGSAPSMSIRLATKCGIHFDAISDPNTIFGAHYWLRGDRLMNVEIKTLPEQRVACVRHKGAYNRINKAFQRLGALAEASTAFDGPRNTMIAIYYDDPESTPAEDLRSDAGVVISNDLKLPSGIEEQRLPAGRYACATHVGPYSELGDFWARFMGEWLPQSGYRVGDGLPFELYRNDPSSVADEALVTEAYLPVREHA